MSTRRFKPYPAYKDSGVEWLGKIPAGWQVKRLKRVFRVVNGSTPASGEQACWDGDIPWVTPEDLGDLRDSTILETRRNITELGYRSCGTTLVLPGSLVLSTRAPIGHLALAGVNLCTNQGCRSLVFRRTASRKFFYYELAAARPELQSLGQGSTFRELAKGMLEDVDIAEPPEPEQRAIAAFLDRETARIDALVAKKERLIELLQEQRTALITRAVTKGLPAEAAAKASLDPNVPMKDSGVKWLGDIPAHWDAERIKWVARMESGHTPDKKVDAYWQGGNIPWVSLADTGQLREVDYIANTAAMTTTDGIAHSSAHILPEGTVVFSRDATIGLCAITRAGMAVSQHFIGWVCGPRLQPEYLLFVLRAMTWELERLTMGATVRTIGMPDVNSLATPVPPVPEQWEIVLYVRKHRERLDSLISKVRDAVERLKELRTALISAAVTGKIDVRAASAEASAGQGGVA